MAFENLKVSDMESFLRCRSVVANAVVANADRDYRITQKISGQLTKMGYTNGKPTRGRNREVVTEYIYLGPFDWIKYKCRDWDWRMGLRRRVQTCYSFARNVFGV